LACATYGSICSIISQLFQESFKSIAHLIVSITILSILLIIVTLWCQALTRIVSLGATIFDEDDWLGHLGLVVGTSHILESSVSASCWENNGRTSTTVM
jgi:hypothetical protein